MIRYFFDDESLTVSRAALSKTLSILFIIGLLLGAGSAPAQVQGALEGQIRGEIVDKVTGRPIANARIILTSKDLTRKSALTDETGNYTFSAVLEGLFTLRVSHEGFLDALEVDVRVVRYRVTRANFQIVRQLLMQEEIIVTAKAVGTTQFASVTATNLNREEIRRGAGTAGDIFRGLDILPGVSSTGEFSNFTVRGRGPRDNLILIDDIPFDKVVHFDRSLGEEEDIGGGGRFAIFAPNLIGNAEFMPGGWQAAYSGRNGSLLRLNVAEGNPDTPSISARIDIAGGELTYDGPSYISGNTSVLLSARYFDFGNLFKLIGQDDIGDPEVADVIFKSVTELSDNHSLSVLALYSPEAYVRDVKNVLQSPDFEDVALFKTDQDSFLLGATWRWLIGSGGQLTNVVFFRDSNKTSSLGESFPDLAGPDPQPSDVTIRDNILNLSENEQEIGWRGDYTSPTPWGVLSLGARYSSSSIDFKTRLDGDWIRYVYDQNDFRPDPSQKYVVLTPERINAAFMAKESNAAAYIDHIFYFGDFSLQPGLRLDRDGFSDQSLWSPRLSAGWQITPRTRLSTTAGVYYQAPRFLEVAADPANNQLRNERTNQFSIGLEYYLNTDLKVAVELYHQDLKDLVILGDETSGQAINNGTGHSAGADFSVQKRMSNEWSASLAYSYSRAKRDDNLGEDRYNADFQRPHVFNIAATWQPNERWSVAGKWKYASGRPTDAFIMNKDIFNNPLLQRFSKEIIANNRNRLRDFHTLNLRVDYRRRVGDVNLVTFIDVINVYGRSNVDSLEFDERRGINVLGDLNVFPQVGFKLEF